MKDELQLKLVEILTSIQNAAGKVGDFAIEQLPDIAQSYVAYGRATTLVWLMAWALVFAACVWATVRKYDAEVWNGDALPPAGLAKFVCAVAAAASLSATLWAFQAAALPWFAPKVWLLTEIARLVR